MKTIKINFKGFWSDFDINHNYFIDILEKRYNVEISEKPDYLFYSVFSDEYINYDDSIRIFFTGECQTPDFNLCDYAVGFDYIEIGDRYFRYPLYMLYGDIPKIAMNRNGMMENPVIKNKFCSFIYSNARAASIRTEFYEKLSEYKKIDSGGRYMNNIGYTVKDKMSFEKDYKFSIAFENSSYPGYTSEKILEAFSAGTIPIYWGDPEICKVYNKNAFINVMSYDMVEEAIREIERLDNNDDLYLEMLTSPILNQGYSFEAERKKFEDFLYSIFDRDKDNAYRRNLTFWGNNYELFHKRYCNINMKLRKIKNVFRK